MTLDSLITLNKNINYGRGYDMFSDGYEGEGITVNICDSDI